MSALYVKNQKKIAKLLKDLSTFDKFGKPTDFDKLNQKLNFWSKCMFVYAGAGTAFYNFVQYLLKNECEKLKIEKKLRFTCGLVLPSQMIFKTDYFPMYQVVFVYMFLVTQLMMKISLLISCNALEMAFNISLRMDHLKMMINKCFKYCDNLDLCRQNFNLCIRYHWEIVE